MQLNKLKLRSTTKCDCGHVFSIVDATDFTKNNDYHFYGGRAEFVANAICPHCKKEYVLMIEAVNNGFRVFDIAEDARAKKNVSKKKQDAPVHVSKPVELEQKVDDACTCKKCGRIFKSVSGLRSHERKCL